MKKLAYLLVVSLFSLTTFAQSTWNVDPMHSFLNFSVKHLGISFVDGKFNTYQGFYQGPSDDITKGQFSFEIEAQSIDTGIEMRDKHLNSADFFEVEKHKSITFTSSKITKVQGQENKYKLEGTLKIKDVSKPVVFDLTFGGYLKDDGNGLSRLGFQAQTTINRFDYNIAYDPTAQAIAKDILLNVNLEFTAN